MLYFILGIVVGAGFIAFYLGVKLLSQAISGYGVPFIPTSDFKVKRLIKHLKLKSGDHFLDLGSGDGKVLQAVERKFHGVKVHGIENSYFPYKLSIQRKKRNKLKYKVHKKDFFKESFKKYDVIYSYTIPYLTEKIWRKIKKECKPGTIFYSNSFEIKKEKPINMIPTTSENFIYVYKVK